jgi:hypothetical protein
MAKSKLIIVLVLATVGALLLWSVALGSELPGTKVKQPQSLSKITGKPQWQILNINNITTWTKYDGNSNHSPGGDNGVFYPVGTGNVVYEDGFIWGGQFYLDAARTQRPSVQPIRIEGSTYSASTYVGIRAGRVTGFGATAVAANPSDPDVRCYRVRRDYYFMTEGELRYDAQTSNELTDANAVTQSQMDAIKQQYDTDWKAWPVSQGAPYIERNGVPGYQAPPPFSATFTQDSLISGRYDEPGVAGTDVNSPADQVIWNAYNDLDRSQSIRFVGSEPSGMEVQKTIWGYKRTDAMGNIYFSRYRMINKGGVDIGGGTRGAMYIDNMYVNQWSDIDLGNAGDDLAGCDSTKSLAFIYNGNPVDNTFAKFNLPPPCSGYDFLAGPEVVAPGDSAIFDLKRIYGKKNLPMSSFAYFSAGSPYSDPPGGSAQYNTGTFQWYAMLQGYAPAGQFGDTYSRYNSGPWPASNFPLSGDPVAQSGFLDGRGTNYSFAPGDRRILLNSGPFFMAPGDTQDVVMGFVVGLGADRLSSVAVMKFNDQFVQNTFDALFQVPKPPPAPKVGIAELDEKVVLEWNDDPVKVADIETKIAQPGGYRFEGYNVYQFPPTSSSLADARRLVTYDTPDDPAVVTDLQPVSGVVVEVPVQFGTNSGIQRMYVFDQDKLNDLAKIYNGRDYYLAVTAYSVATVPGFLPTALESPPIIYKVTPHGPEFGVRYATNYGDTLVVTKTGNSEGNVFPLVIDPKKSTGDTYEVGFSVSADQTLWSVTDKTKNKVVVTGQSNQSGDDLYPIVDGIMVKVTGPSTPGMKGYQIPAGTREFTWSGADWGLEGFSGAMGMAYNSWFSSSTIGPDKMHNVLLKFGTAAAPWDPNNPPSDPNFSYGYRYLRGATAAPAKPEFAPFIVNPTAGYAYQDFKVSIPFSAWDQETDPPTRLAVAIFENNVAAGFVDGVYFPGSSSTTDNTVSREFFFIFATPYSTTPDPALQVDFLNNSLPVMWWGAPNRRGSNTFHSGDQFLIIAAHLNTASVTFTFTAPAVQPATTDVQKTDLSRINVFPNPYYCINSQETSRFAKFVTFINMPQQATVRIFNLAGQLARVLHKNDASSFMKWDLLNEINYPVASGMYIAYIDIPGVGSKVLKLAVIQEQELLDLY